MPPLANYSHCTNLSSTQLPFEPCKKCSAVSVRFDDADIISKRSSPAHPLSTVIASFVGFKVVARSVFRTVVELLFLFSFLAIATLGDPCLVE